MAQTPQEAIDYIMSYKPEELFDKNKSLGEVDNHKNRSQDYETLFRVDMDSKIYAYAYGDHVFYDELVHPPICVQPILLR